MDTPHFQFLEHLPTGVFALDSSGRPFYSNHVARKLLGRGIDPNVAAEHLAETYQAYIGGTDSVYPTARMPIVRALRGESTVVDDMEIVCPGGRVPLEVWATPIYDDSGALCYAIAVFQDITKRRQAEAAAVVGEQRFRTLFENAPIGMALLDLEGRFVAVNRAKCELTGYSEPELLGMTVEDVTHPDDAETDRALMAQVLAGEIDHYRIEKRYVRPSGDVVWVVLARSLVTDAGGRRLYIAQAEDITARKQAEHQLAVQALHDALTGLPNRLLLADRLKKALAATARTGSLVGVLYLDLDGFKTINDRFGHQAGDELLVAVAERLRSAIRPSDTAARVGGDEFVVLCADLGDPAQAHLVADRAATLLRQPYEFRAGRVTVGASIGVATGSHGDPDELLREADAAMYLAKGSGHQ